MIRLLQRGLAGLVLLVIVLALGSCGGGAATPAPTTGAKAATGSPKATETPPAPTSAPTSSPQSCDPQMSVISVQGDLEFSDIAQAFLDGKDPSGSINYSAVSLGFIGYHQHLTVTNTSEYYYDPVLLNGVPGAVGMDTDSSEGIDRAMLLFYVGHGEPTSFDALGQAASPANMRLGNCAGGGMLRYYWQLSCQVFAHGPNEGPKLCGDSGISADPCYDNPGGWSISSTLTTTQDVFDRWGPVLDPSLRMACGASTDVPADPSVVGLMWYDQVKKKYDVSDSFIHSIWKTGYVALCITLGGEDMTATPLVTDTTFTTKANTAGATRYHIEYAQVFGAPYTSVANEGSTPPMPPPLLPIIAVNPDTPAEYREGKLEQGIAFKDPLSEGQYVGRALAYLQENGLYEPIYAQPVGVHLRLASVPVDREARVKEGSMQIAQKNVIVAFRRQLNLREIVAKSGADISGAALESIPERINVLGPDGGIEVQLNNDGTVRRASKMWRRVLGVKDIVQTKSYDEALKEAQAQLGDQSAGLEVGRWTWGYREAVDREKQDTLYPEYEFWFVPAKGRTPITELATKRLTSRDYPPEVIYVRADR